MSGVPIDSLTHRLPAPAEIAQRIASCQEELAALRKLLRVAVTVYRAEAARQHRQQQEAAHASR